LLLPADYDAIAVYAQDNGKRCFQGGQILIELPEKFEVIG